MLTARTLPSPALTAPPAAAAAPARGAPHAIVIGSGFGGLAAAVRLGARGYRVTVLEQLDRPGGRARVHEIDGYVFDAGPTVITAPHLFEDLWALCGRRLADDVALVPVAPFYRLRFDDGSVFDASEDPDHMRSEVQRLSQLKPEENEDQKKTHAPHSSLAQEGGRLDNARVDG